MKLCPFCEMVFSDDIIKDHIGSKHLGIPNIKGKPKDSEAESKVIESEESMHVKNKSENEYSGDARKCDLCEKTFQDLLDINNHIKEIHQDENNRYVCEMCDKNYLVKQGLKSHIESIHKGKRHPCSKCDKTFFRSDELKNHIKKGIHERSKHNCDNCDKSFTSKKALKEHLNDLHTIKKACEHCEKHFASKHALTLHKKSSHTEVALKCDQCGKTFQNLTSKEKHERNHQRESCNIFRYFCEMCPKKYTQLNGLQYHIKSVHQNIKHDCDKCGKSFTTSGGLKVHNQDVHLKIPHKCEKCGKKYTTNSGLKLHMKTDHDGIKLKCFLCEEKFASMVEKRSHVKKNHQNKNGQFECELCKKTFATTQVLKLHIESVHERKRQICTKCNKSFHRIDALKNHIKTCVSTGKEYKCEKCEKSFISNSDLELHVNSCDVLLKCLYCREKFTSLNEKKNHQKSEHRSQNGYFQCKHCEKSVLKKQSLKWHYEAVHEGKRYSCSDCHKCFTKNSELKTHIKVIHEKSKVYHCKLCNFVCKNRMTLHCHCKSKHGGIKYLCEQCPNSFSRRLELKNHIKIVHKKT